MKIIQLIEKKFWLLLLISVILGILIPTPFKQLDNFVIPGIMLILFLTYLKIDFIEIVSHIKKPGFLLYILITFLIIIPVCIYLLFKNINQDLAVGLLLLCSMPPGVASPVFTDIVKGNTSLSVVVSIIANVLAPITVFALFYFLTHQSIHLDLNGIFFTLLIACFVPLILAQSMRKINRKFIQDTQTYYGGINILIIMLLIYIIIAKQSYEITHNPINILIEIIWLYILFFFFHIIGYYVAFWRNKKDKIALSVSRTYLNTALAIGLAITYFDPKIALLIALSEIPWGTTLGLFKFALKYTKND